MNLETLTNCCYVLATRIDDFYHIHCSNKTGDGKHRMAIKSSPHYRHSKNMAYKRYWEMVRIAWKNNAKICSPQNVGTVFNFMPCVLQQLSCRSAQSSFTLRTFIRSTYFFLHDSRGRECIGVILGRGWGCQETGYSCPVRWFGNSL
jgi:hypothetical protein